LNGVSGENRLEVSFKAPSSSVALTKYRAYFDTTAGGGAVTPTDAGSGTADAEATDAGVSDGGDAGASDGGVTGTSDGGDAGAEADAGVADAGVADAGTNDAGTSADAGTDAGSTGDAGTGTTTAACGSGILIGGNVAPVNAAGVIRTGASESKTVTLTDLSNVAIDQTVAVAVVAIDPAGNESKLSVPTCVTRKETFGFRDTCRAADEGDCGLESCNLHPTNKGSALSMALLALALTALIRRRGRA
jgi:hypothetical protein